MIYEVSNATVVYNFIVITYNRLLYDVVVLSFSRFLRKYSVMMVSAKPKVSQNKVRLGFEVYLISRTRK